MTDAERSRPLLQAPSRCRQALLAAATSALLAACGDGNTPSPLSGGDAPDNGAGATDNDPGEGSGGDGAGAEGAAPVPFATEALADEARETRVTRLSHSQYLHTVQDLFGISGSLDLTFAPDALNGFNFDTGNDLRVDARLGPQYREAAERLAARVVGDDTLFQLLVPCDVAAADCPEQFLRAFGERAFRRPLAEDELTALLDLFGRAPALEASGDAFRDGLRLTLEAILQSPQFLYRTEATTEIGPDGRVVLGDWEVASRLSYFLFDSMPDDELFEAARSGQLTTADEIASAARRMLTRPRVLDKLISFHAQAWEFGRFSRISPDPTTYPEVPNGFVDRVRRGAELFVEEVLATGGGLQELLTAPFAFADRETLPLYGVQGAEGSGFQRVDFPQGERKGLLMQLGFLAANSYSIRTDPIHRGLFVVRHLLCRAIPDPPPGASTTPLPETDEPINTTRDEIALLTGQSFCPTCHTQINPPGFAFEGFDASGQARTDENGFPVDTSADMILDGQRVSFSGPGELVELLAASSEAHRCYSRRWVEFAQGRPLSEDDLPLLDVLASESRPAAEIIAALVTSPQFSSLGPTASSAEEAE